MISFEYIPKPVLILLTLNKSMSAGIVFNLNLKIYIHMVCYQKKPIDQHCLEFMCLHSNQQNRYSETFNKHLKNSQKGVHL